MVSKEKTSKKIARKRVMVTGAGGFIGRNLMEELLSRGYEVTAFDLFFPEDEVFKSPHCTCVKGDVRNKEEVSQACRGAKAVIHLAGAIRLSDYQANYDIHVKGAENLVSACREQGITRLIAYSSIAAAKEQLGPYGATKKESERIFFSSGLEITVFRPTVVLGEGSIGLKTILKQIQAYPFFIPLIGSGKAIGQPVWVKDVVKVTVDSLDNSLSHGKIYDLGGADQVEFKELVKAICRRKGISKTFVLLPLVFARAAAFVFELWMEKPPFTSENVRNVAQDTKADIAPAERELGFAPAPLERVLNEVVKGEK